MNILGGVIGGAIGGAIGAAIWGAVGHYTGYEVGWIAWGIGALAGAGVSVGTKGGGGALGAALAVVLAVAGILVGKWAVIHFAIQGYLDPEDQAIAVMADVIIAEQEEAGRTVFLPEPRNPSGISDFYPEAAWRDARARWNALAPPEQEARRELPPLGNPDFVLSSVADEIVMQMNEEDFASFEWPAEGGFDEAWREAHYPPELWADAETVWAELDEDAQAAYVEGLRASAIANVEAERTAMRDEATKSGLLASFSLFDLLWVVLAVGTAAKLGYGEPRKSADEPAMTM